MIQPYSVEDFNKMSERQKMIWINYESGNQRIPETTGTLIYAESNLIVHFTRDSKGKLINIFCETIKHYKQRAVMMVLAKKAVEEMN